MNDQNKERKNIKFIPPDYSDAVEKTVEELTSDPDIDELSYDDQDFFIDDTPDDDEEIEEEINPVIEQNKENERIMATPFITPASPTPSFGGGSSSIWGNQSSGNSFWDKPSTPTTFGTPKVESPWNTGAGTKQQINRNKKIIFCDFLDCIVETIESKGRPGLRPRDIYDLRSRFEVWERLAAFNPERVFILISDNLIPSSANGINAWNITLSYYCCCLSSFFRLPFESCQVLKQSRIDQTKSQVIGSIINNPNLNIKKEDAVMIGTYSGNSGMSDIDKRAAEVCGIDYIDLNQLITNMF